MSSRHPFSGYSEERMEDALSSAEGEYMLFPTTSNSAQNKNDFERAVGRPIIKASTAAKPPTAIHERDNGIQVNIIPPPAYESKKFIPGEIIIDPKLIKTIELLVPPTEIINPKMTTQNEYASTKPRPIINTQKGKRLCCFFCKNNKEDPNVYESHILKDNRGKVLCPQLRKYVCPVCGATGDNAHTISHCPHKDPRYVSVTMYESKRLSNGELKKQYR